MTMEINEATEATDGADNAALERYVAPVVWVAGIVASIILLMWLSRVLSW
jgi:hypothetical protein